MVRVSPSTWVYSAIGVFAGITAFSHSILLAAILIGVSMYMVLQELLTYDKRQKKLEDERRASEERLKNPACAALLKRLDYPVPSRYLAPVQQDVAFKQSEISGVGQN